MKILGIIGGLGPATTAEFYSKISYDCQKIGGEHRPHIIITSVPTPYKLERSLILENKDSFAPLLCEEGARLERAGADFIVMPCNTLHCEIDKIRAAAGVEVLSIVEETVAYIKEKAFACVGFLSTMATVKRNVYSDIFAAQGVNFVTPTEAEQAQLNRIIINLVDGKFLDSDRQTMDAVIDNLQKRGADCIALACTDLQLLKPARDDIPIFDTMSILADAAVKHIMEDEEAADTNHRDRLDLNFEVNLKKV